MTEITRDRFLAAKLEQKRLLQMLAETDRAASSLPACKLQYLELRNKSWDASGVARELHEAMDRHKDVALKYKGSRLRRLGLSLRGKPELIQQEEAAYLQLQERYATASVKAEEAERQATNAQKQRDELEAFAKKHWEYKNQIEALYDSLFDGATPEYPKDDEMEAEYQSAKKIYDAIEAELFYVADIVNNLSSGLGSITSAINSLERAMDANLNDIFDIGVASADARVEQELAHAQRDMAKAAAQINASLEKARIDPAVQGVPEVQLPQKDLVWDIIFDCTFTAVLMQDKIEKSQAQLMQMKQYVELYLHAFEERLDSLHKTAEGPHKDLAHKREALLQLRSQILEQQILGGEEGKEERDGN